MSDSLSPNRATWLAKALYQVSITVRTAAAYLGLAALVVVFLAVSVPTMRQQVALLHQGALLALVPEGTRVGLAVESANGILGLAPLAQPIDLEAVPERALEPADSGEVESERTDMVGLLGDIALTEIEAAREQFGITEAQVDALEHFIARRYRVARTVTARIVESALVTGAELNINPVLILAVMSIESRFNPYAESHAGAQGLMQVMTRVHTDKFELFGQGPLDAFHPEINIRVGAQILYDCIRRRGSIVNGLKCYVGATGPNDGGYSDKVLAEQRRMALAAKIKL